MYKILELNFIQVIQKMQKYTFKYICKSIDEKLLKKTPSFSSKKWCWQTIYFPICDQNILLEERRDSKETFFQATCKERQTKYVKT